MIRIRYFARLRETLGADQEVLEALPERATVADLLARLRERGGVWAEALGPQARVLVAVNQDLARPETLIRDADEVALFPPVTGG
jgi:molybdopterin synthase sulfur carrier subunit